MIIFEFQSAVGENAGSIFQQHLKKKGVQDRSLYHQEKK